MAGPGARAPLRPGLPTRPPSPRPERGARAGLLGACVLRGAGTGRNRKGGGGRPPPPPSMRHPDRNQAKNWPPLAEITEPVMKPASSEDRKATQRAISSGSPRRPTGIWAMIDSRTFSGTAMTMSVAI